MSMFITPISKLQYATMQRITQEPSSNNAQNNKAYKNSQTDIFNLSTNILSLRNAICIINNFVPFVNKTNCKMIVSLSTAARQRRSAYRSSVDVVGWCWASRVAECSSRREGIRELSKRLHHCSLQHSRSNRGTNHPTPTSIENI